MTSVGDTTPESVDLGVCWNLGIVTSILFRNEVRLPFPTGVMTCPSTSLPASSLMLVSVMELRELLILPPVPGRRSGTLPLAMRSVFVCALSGASVTGDSAALFSPLLLRGS